MAFRLRCSLPVINIYAYDVDFQRDIHSGDHFEIMYETKVDDEGECYMQRDYCICRS